MKPSFIHSKNAQGDKRKMAYDEVSRTETAAMERQSVEFIILYRNDRLRIRGSNPGVHRTSENTGVKALEADSQGWYCTAEDHKI